MSTIWYALGNACSDDGFRQELLARVEPGTLVLGDLEDLYEFFRTQTQYCPTRWELVEINRVMSHAGLDDGPMPKIAAAWGSAPRTDAFLAIIGLACVDAVLRETIPAGTAAEVRQTLSDGPPRLQLTLGQTEALRDLLGRDAGGKTVVQRLDEVEFLGWIPSDPECDPGATFTTTYHHANPLIISCMQDLAPLKSYLASEPVDRNDRVEIRDRLRDLLGPSGT